jgi:hypothetical protein
VTKKKKQQYRIRNWQQYNKALVKRGSLTLWIDSHVIETWLDVDCPSRRGRRPYTDVSILCSLMLREVYHLPLRATEGLLLSLMSQTCDVRGGKRPIGKPHTGRVHLACQS